jgi:hypothetical protein
MTLIYAIIAREGILRKSARSRNLTVQIGNWLGKSFRSSQNLKSEAFSRVMIITIITGEKYQLSADIKQDPLFCTETVDPLNKITDLREQRQFRNTTSNRNWSKRTNWRCKDRRGQHFSLQSPHQYQSYGYELRLYSDINTSPCLPFYFILLCKLVACTLVLLLNDCATLCWSAED